MSEKNNELIIDPKLLAEIQAACKRRAAKLEAAGSAAAQAVGVPTSRTPVVGPEEQARRFAAATQQMPTRVRAFFEHEDPVPPWRWESNEDRAQRERLTALLA